MKFFRTNKYNVKLTFLKYSFIAVIVVSLMLSTFVSKNIASAVDVSLSGINLTSSSIDLVASGLKINVPVIFVVDDGKSFNQIITIPASKNINGTVTASFSNLLPNVEYQSTVDIDANGNGLVPYNFKLPLSSPPDENTVKINSISPLSGHIGDMVTISGDNFIGVSSIYFGDVKTTTTTSSKNEITVKVPVGAKNSQITVNTLGYGSATSKDVYLAGLYTDPTISTSTGSTTSVIPTSNSKNAKVVWHGLVPVCNSGVIDPATSNYSNACDFNTIMGLINKLINFVLVDLATPLFVIIIIYVAWLYLSSGGSSENTTKAKKIFFNVIIGYVIALAAWLIVKTILTTLGFTGDSYLS